MDLERNEHPLSPHNPIMNNNNNNNDSSTRIINTNVEDLVVGLNNIYQYLSTVRPAHVRDDTELACHLMLDIMFVTCAKLLIHTRFNLHKLIGTIGLAHSGTFGSHSQTCIVRSKDILSAVVFVFQQHTRINNQISQTD